MLNTSVSPLLSSGLADLAVDFAPLLMLLLLLLWARVKSVVLVAAEIVSVSTSLVGVSLDSCVSIGVLGGSDNRGVDSSLGWVVFRFWLWKCWRRALRTLATARPISSGG